MSRFRVAAVLVIVLALAGCEAFAGTTAPRRTGAGKTSAAAYFSDPVPIGVKYDEPGFSVDKLGDFAGFDTDLANYLAGQLHFSPGSFVQVNDSDRASSLGTIVKLVIATYSITSGREHGLQGQPQVDFVGPYMVTPDALLVRQGSKYATSNPNLAHASLCTVEDSTTGPTAVTGPNGIPVPRGARLLTRPDYSKCVNLVERGKVDAVWTDALILYGYADEHIKYPGLVVESTQYTRENQYGIGVPHGQVAACKALIPVVQSFLQSANGWEAYFRDEFFSLTQQDSTWQQDYKPAAGAVPATSYCK